MLDAHMYIHAYVRNVYVRIATASISLAVSFRILYYNMVIGGIPTRLVKCIVVYYYVRAIKSLRVKSRFIDNNNRYNVSN